MDLGIRGEIALVLGGTQGLALSAAHHLSDAGAIVILNGRDTDKGAQAVAELPNPGHFVQGDITIAADRAAIIAKTAALAGAVRRPASSWITTTRHGKRRSATTCSAIST
jgi:3-oxoacyl-[acyl-carrier protein] reductase